MHLRTLFTTALLSHTISAQLVPAAIVVIEASHGGAGQDLTNITVTIPLTTTYTNASALAAVSTLYLVDSRNTPLNSVSCTPFKHLDGTGKGGLTFDSTTPSYLSTNTVQVGSIVCISTDISVAPPTPHPGHRSFSSSSSGLVAASSSSSSTTVETKTKTGASTWTAVPTGQSSTPTETQVPTTSTATAAQNTASPSASSSLVPASTGAASNFGLSSELFSGLALAGFGVAFAL